MGKNSRAYQGCPRYSAPATTVIAERRANGMQNAVARVAVLLQVELEELVVGCELLWLGHGICQPGNAGINLERVRKCTTDGQNARSYVTIFYSNSK